ncbi:hypothetical protein ACS7OT_02510 [Bacillus safensis]
MNIFKVRITFRRILAKMVALLIEAGDSINAIQKRAGHASAKTTSDIYGHVTSKLEFNTAEHFNRFDPKNTEKQSGG